MRFFGVRAMAACLLTVGLLLPRAQAEYQPKGKRDPLIPLLNSEGQRVYPPGFDEEVSTGIQGLVLQGIVFDRKADSYAILNGQLVREQGEIDGMKVLEIGPRSVTILAGGQKHQLVIQEPSKEEGRSTQKETQRP